MQSHRFKQVDVFTSRPYWGNPVAVVLDADQIDAAQMQRIARWTNLSETTFVLRPTTSEADYLLRIFTPAGELPFAGHPTIGSAHAVLESGLLPAGRRSLRQECGAGILPLTVDGEGDERQIFVQVPEPKLTRDCGDVVERLDEVLGGRVATNPAPRVVDLGPRWLIARMESGEAVSALSPDPGGLARLSQELDITGVTVFGPCHDGDATVRVRSFAPAAGIWEDPVCGSGNASVGAYLAYAGLLSQAGGRGGCYVATQGTEMGRDGRVFVRVADGGRCIEIGGSAVTAIEGEIRV